MPPTHLTLRRLARHPRVEMAIKAAVAATAAWLVARELPGDAATYSFYAPLGAVAMLYPGVARSATESVRSVLAIMLGAGLGVLADALLGANLAGIAVVVGLGVLLAGLPWLGDGRAYVPIAGMFTMLLGQGDEFGFGLTYASLFLLGAALTIALNALFPSLPVDDADRAVARLREACATRLEEFAARLGTADTADTADVPPDHSPLATEVMVARSAVETMRDAARANRRARRDPDAITGRTDGFRALERAVLLIDDLHGLSLDAPWGTTIGTLPAELREPLAEALRELAGTIREVALTDDEPGRRLQAHEAMAALTAAVRRFENEGGAGAVVLVAGTIATTLRRSLSALTPDDRIQLPVDPLHDAEDPPPSTLVPGPRLGPDPPSGR